MRLPARTMIESAVLHLAALSVVLWLAHSTAPNGTETPQDVDVRWGNPKAHSHPAEEAAHPLQTMTQKLEVHESSDTSGSNSPRTQSDAVTSATEGGEVNPSYFMQVRSQLDRAVDYPMSLRARGMTGQVGLRIVLDRHGEVRSASIQSSSGHAALDQIALDAVKRASPFPPFEDSFAKSHPTLDILIPIEFKNPHGP